MITLPDSIESLLSKTDFSILPKLAHGRDLALPFGPKPVADKTNQIIKPLPSINKFDLPGIKLDLFKRFNPSIVKIHEVENKRKYGYQYQEETFKSLTGQNVIDDEDLKIKKFASRIPGLGMKQETRAEFEGYFQRMPINLTNPLHSSKDMFELTFS